MLRTRAVGLALLLLPVLALSACNLAPSFIVRDEPWRPEEERACLASGLVQEAPPFLTARASLGGPLSGYGESGCGALKPFRMEAAAHGSVTFDPPALVQCPMVHAIEWWTEHVVRPAARRYLKAEVVGLKIAASYSCRPMNSVSGALLSEHGHANAIDVSGFAIADGRVVRVASWYDAPPAESGFLQEVRKGSCSVFTTVLGPGYPQHGDHFHLDLARHHGDARICK